MGGRHIVAVKDKSITDEEFNSGDENRYEHILQLLTHSDFKQSIANKDEVPVIIAGDFNCVSHLDYTKRSKSRGLNYSRIVDSKCSKAMLEYGFTDSYRYIHSKIREETLGHTWTTVGQGYTYKPDVGFVPVKVNPSPEYQDPYARIDFIYSAGKAIKAIASKTILNHSSNMERSFPEFPSDHGAVLTTFKLD